MMSIISYLKKLLFVGLVTGATMSMVYAGTGATVTRGSVPATPNVCTTCSAGYQLDGGSCYGCGLSKCT